MAEADAGGAGGPARRWRLFVALALPADVRGELAAWAREQAAAGSGLRPLPAESLHLTLRFIGSLPAGAVAGIVDACRTVAGVPAPTLRIAEPIWLPARRPRALALELAEAAAGARAGRLAELHAAVVAALAGAGLREPEARPLLAHVTVARAGTRRRLRAVELPAPEPRPPFTAVSVVLYRSHLGAGGARYEALETVELRR